MHRKKASKVILAASLATSLVLNPVQVLASEVNVVTDEVIEEAEPAALSDVATEETEVEAEPAALSDEEESKIEINGLKDQTIEQEESLNVIKGLSVRDNGSNVYASKLNTGFQITAVNGKDSHTWSYKEREDANNYICEHAGTYTITAKYTNADGKVGTATYTITVKPLETPTSIYLMIGGKKVELRNQKYESIPEDNNRSAVRIKCNPAKVQPVLYAEGSVLQGRISITGQNKQGAQVAKVMNRGEGAALDISGFFENGSMKGGRYQITYSRDGRGDSSVTIYIDPVAPTPMISGLTDQTITQEDNLNILKGVTFTDDEKPVYTYQLKKGLSISVEKDGETKTYSYDELTDASNEIREHAGTYHVTLTFKGESGNEESASCTITVNPLEVPTSIYLMIDGKKVELRNQKYEVIDGKSAIRVTCDPSKVDTKLYLEGSLLKGYTSISGQDGQGDPVHDILTLGEGGTLDLSGFFENGSIKGGRYQVRYSREGLGDSTVTFYIDAQAEAPENPDDTEKPGGETPDDTQKPGDAEKPGSSVDSQKPGSSTQNGVKKPNTQSAKSVRTGDTSSVLTWMMTAAMAGIAFLASFRKRRNMK